MSSIRFSHGKGQVNIAYLANDPTPNAWQNVPTFQDYLNAARSHSLSVGLSLNVIWTRERGMNGARLEQILRARGIKALLIGPMQSSCAHLSLNWANYSSVTLGHSLAAPKLDRVVSDQKRAVELALRQARKLGYKRPGLFVSKWQDTRSGFNFSAGYYAWVAAHGCSGIPPLLIDWIQKHEAKSWLTKYVPDVIISSGLGNFDFLKEVTSDIGKKIGYIDIDLAKNDGAIAGVNQNHFFVGCAAIDLLAHKIGRGETGIPEHPKTVMIEGDWIPGATLRKRKPAQTLRYPDR